MRIRNNSTNRIAGKQVTGGKSGTGKPLPVSGEPVFEEVLKAEKSLPLSGQPDSNEGALHELLGNLDSAGSELARMPSQQNFLAYRDQIRKLTRYILDNGFRTFSWKDRKNRSYEVIQKINADLEKLLSDITRRNPETTVILYRMAEIRGLIVDSLA